MALNCVFWEWNLRISIFSKRAFDFLNEYNKFAIIAHFQYATILSPLENFYSWKTYFPSFDDKNTKMVITTEHKINMSTPFEVSLITCNVKMLFCFSYKWQSAEILNRCLHLETKPALLRVQSGLSNSFLEVALNKYI